MTPTSKDMLPLADETTALLKALAHPARLMICCQLRDGEMSVSEIEETLDIRQPRLSRELSKLREEGIVETRREAKSVFYRLSDETRAAPMIDALCMVMLDKIMPDAKPLGRVARNAFIKRNLTDGSGHFARIIA